MRLKTDFPQWYDEIFDQHGPVFERMAFSRGGWSKRKALAHFDTMGLGTPPHGLVKDLADLKNCPFGMPDTLWHEVQDCVVYEDEWAHLGQGKLRLSLAEALRTHPDHYASLFIPSAGPATNLRHARFGRIGLWIRQTATHGDWRSNQYADEPVVNVTWHNEPPPFERMLWAIDFIPSPFGLLALDFNTAPQLATVGVEKAVSMEALAAEIRHVAQVYPTHLLQF